MADFEPRVLDTLSSGLVYRAVLAIPLDEFHPHEMHVVVGKPGHWIVMLPFSGARGKPPSSLTLKRNFLNWRHRTVVVMQRRLGVRRQACGSCRGRSSSQDMSIVTSAVRVDVADLCQEGASSFVEVFPVTAPCNQTTAFSGLMRPRSSSCATPLIVTNGSRDSSVEARIRTRHFCQSDYRL